MRGSSEFRRRAATLQAAGLLPSAERVAHTWRARAQAAGDAASALEADVRTLSIALDRDQPEVALQVGRDALLRLTTPASADPEVTARLIVSLAKAAWSLGREPELSDFLDGAARVLERAPVSTVVRAHFALTSSLAAMDRGDGMAAAAWAIQALDLAAAGGRARLVRRCVERLIHAHLLRGDAARASALLGQVLAADQPDAEIVSVLADAVRIALLAGDLEGAASWARRLVAGYCAAPSRLSPIAMGSLFETLGALYAQAGHPQAARWLWETGAGWFAQRGRARDVERLRGLSRRNWPAGPDAPAAVDEALLYLGDLVAAADHRPAGQSTRQLADTVRRLLPEVAPEAQPVATEHAALLYGLPASARWFTGRTAEGQAAERVLADHGGPELSALDVLAAYERVATSGASWVGVMRYMQRDGLNTAHVAALDQLYTSATA
jgi:hypothetical protein